MSYNSIKVSDVKVSSVLTKPYTRKEEELNLKLYKETVKDLINEEEIYNEIEDTFNEVVSTLLVSLDIIDIKIKEKDTVRQVAGAIAGLTFKYLYSNFYFDIKPIELIMKLEEIYKNKNKDYNNSAERQLDLDGIPSFKMRIQDKISRLNSFNNNRDMCITEEKVTDTLADLFNYCMIFLIWFEKNCS